MTTTTVCDMCRITPKNVHFEVYKGVLLCPDCQNKVYDFIKTEANKLTPEERKKYMTPGGICPECKHHETCPNIGLCITCAYFYGKGEPDYAHHYRSYS